MRLMQRQRSFDLVPQDPLYVYVYVRGTRSWKWTGFIAQQSPKNQALYTGNQFSTQHDARQRSPALIILKEENNNNHNILFLRYNHISIQELIMTEIAKGQRGVHTCVRYNSLSWAFTQCAGKLPEFAEITQNNAIMPLKVIQGHRFWYQSKAHMQFPVSD